MLYNYHTHTTYCDGKNKPEEMVQKAIELGFSELGFSGHPYTAFDEAPCMTREGTKQYKKEINELKVKYKDQIKILLGVEQDYYCEEPTSDYDYVLGSVHYVFKNGDYIIIDLSKEHLQNMIEKHYSGDIYSLIEDYYALVGDVYNKTKCDIIGHFDLIEKFNGDGTFFDRNHPRYIAAWTYAAQKLLKTPAVVEINTGGIARGYLDTPYPSQQIIDYFKENGKKLIFASDCHNKDYLLCGYESVKSYL